MNCLLKRLGVMSVLATAALGFAQDDVVSVWKPSVMPILPEQDSTHAFLSQYRVYSLNYNEYTAQLKTVPRQMVGSIATGRVIELPRPDGSMQRFLVAESPVMTDELSAKIPSRTYRVQGLDDRYATGRIDFGLNGLHAFIQSAVSGDYIIDPINNRDHTQYVAYFRRDNLAPRSFTCYTDAPPKASPAPEFMRMLSFGTLKTYKLAMYATVEYSAVFGATTNATRNLAQTAIITSINRVNQVYETDLAIHLNIVLNNPYVNSDGDDGFTNDDGGTMLGENQTKCDANPGNANYDIGHVFSTGGGGIAGLQVVGVTGQKAWGVTGLDNPQGDGYDIDYVAHEMGHQFGANHTFNSTAWACGGGNRSASHAYEPGSGSTIMAYAGICPPEDLQPHSDPYMHFDSMTAIWAWRNNAGSGGSEASNGNSAPTANAGSDYTIPQGTPYLLTGSGSDSNGDSLTYCWEQKDLGTSTANPTDVSTGPLVRSFNPSTSNKRYVPQLATVIAGTTDNYEKLPNVNRSINYRLTVRDNHSGGGNYATDDMVITVNGAPFSVSAPNGGESLSDTTTVTWNVGGSLAASANVDILLSTNGGTTWGTTLLANTPNDGSQLVTLPSINSTTCRAIVKAHSSIFYDMSNANFTVTPGAGPSLSSVVLAVSSVVGGNSTTGTVNLSANATSNTSVTLSDNAGSTVTTPANVTVTTGTSSAGFNVTTTAVVSVVHATITASFNGVNKTDTLDVTPPLALVGLSISPDPVRSGGKPTGTVTLSGPAGAGGILVALSEHASDISVPASVTVTEGSSTADFLVTTLVIQSQTTRTITATYNGNSVSDTITLQPFNITTIVFSPSNLRGGQTATCTVTFSDPAPPNLQLRIADNDARTGVPNTVDVPEGATSVDFSITSVGTPTQFQSTITYKIGANYTKVKYLNVYPPLNYTLTLSPTTVKGGTKSTATSTILGKAYAGLTMNTTSSNTATATVPASITYSTNQSSKNFTVTTFAVASTRNVIIRTTFGGVTKAATLTVTP